MINRVCNVVRVCGTVETVVFIRLLKKVGTERVEAYLLKGFGAVALSGMPQLATKNHHEINLMRLLAKTEAMAAKFEVEDEWRFKAVN